MQLGDVITVILATETYVSDPPFTCVTGTIEVGEYTVTTLNSYTGLPDKSETRKDGIFFLNVPGIGYDLKEGDKLVITKL
jgi:hypothetical protein